MFLDRLFNAFSNVAFEESIDYKEFMEGLSKFLRGTSDEKIECLILFFILLFIGSDV